jgi:hypothetical protein
MMQDGKLAKKERPGTSGPADKNPSSYARKFGLLEMSFSLFIRTLRPEI